MRTWLPAALGAMRAHRSAIKWAAFFVADSEHHDGQWPSYALHERTGALAAADAEAGWLQSHGW